MIFADPYGAVRPDLIELRLEVRIDPSPDWGIA
jgi:hypothetical protein